jgi:hypothetical protein
MALEFRQTGNAAGAVKQPDLHGRHDLQNHNNSRGSLDFKSGTSDDCCAIAKERARMRIQYASPGDASGRLSTTLYTPASIYSAHPSLLLLASSFYTACQLGAGIVL